MVSLRSFSRSGIWSIVSNQRIFARLDAPYIMVNYIILHFNVKGEKRCPFDMFGFTAQRLHADYMQTQPANNHIMQHRPVRSTPPKLMLSYNYPYRINSGIYILYKP
jgi:hypothetical protein